MPIFLAEGPERTGRGRDVPRLTIAALRLVAGAGRDRRRRRPRSARAAAAAAAAGLPRGGRAVDLARAPARAHLLRLRVADDGARPRTHVPRLAAVRARR